MFTGITQGVFLVVAADEQQGVLDYTVELSDALSAGLALGASVSIDGVCQTVVSVVGNRVRFQAINETLRLTTLDELEKGNWVSVERSFRVGDEMGGHEVAGHVKGTGIVSKRTTSGDNLSLRLSVPQAWLKYVLEKGFVAVDGSSLTVGAVDSGGAFDVHLIPETCRLTKLGQKQAGDRVNIELDARTVAIVDTVERVLDQRFGENADQDD